MKSFKFINKLLTSAALVVFFMFTGMMTVSADGTTITENATYVLDRDSNGDYLYQYQSPCMLGYDINNQNGGNGSPIQCFVFTMYDTVNGKHFPTYCTDIHVTAVQGGDYRRLNLEDSPYAESAAGQIRAILQEGFYIIPIEGESTEAHADRVNAKAEELGKAAGVDDLTVGEAISATQAAIWKVAHGPSLSFPKFCRSVFNPTNTKYKDLCSYSVLKAMDNALINSRIEKAYDYLLSLNPVEATETSVSPASFVDIQDPVLSRNEDGSYNVSVTTTVNVEMSSGDSLTLEAKLNEDYSGTKALSDGKNKVNITIENVPVEVAKSEMTLSISGNQTAEGYFLFDSEGERGSSQTMVGYSSSRLPVYAEVAAKENRNLNILKTTADGVALKEIVFDIYPVASLEDYLSGKVELPDAANYEYPNLAEYTLITDENGKASFSFTDHGLSDGVYLVVEHEHPAIVKPLEPFYLTVPMTSEDGKDYIYDITINPKNEVKGELLIEKDVISIGNDKATVNAYKNHTWIIGTSIPADISAGKSYVISDTLDNRLDYIGNVVLKLEDTTGEGNDVTLELDTDYKITVTDVDSLSEGKPSDSFVIELTKSGMRKMANTVNANSFSNYMLRTYFDAQINANAEMGTEIPNWAELDYTNSLDFDYNVKSDIPVVYTGAANLVKVDANDHTNVLPGAIFEVYRPATAEELEAGGDFLTEIDGVKEMVVKESFFNNSLLEGEKVEEVITDENGKAAIYGLAYGKYYLLETKAPDGYNLVGKPLEIEINESSHIDENTITVENKMGLVLPETGGIGTTGFMVAGLLLMGISGIMLYYKKRRLVK